jgi:hypothetical protein
MIGSFDFQTSFLVVCFVAFFVSFLFISFFVRLRRLKRNSFAPLKIGFLHPDLGIGIFVTVSKELSFIGIVWLIFLGLVV